MSPPEITVKVPLSVFAAKTVAIELVNCTASTLSVSVSVLTKVTAPLKALLACVKVINASSAEVVKLDTPSTSKAPV